MTNAEWMIKNGYKFRNIEIRILYGACYGIFVNGTRIDTYECQSGMLTSEIMCGWLDMEHKESILDDAEKKYLSAVLRPFRDKKYKVLKRYSCEYKMEYLGFCSEEDSFCLPSFKAGTMYKSMENGRTYTLDELGL